MATIVDASLVLRSETELLGWLAPRIQKQLPHLVAVDGVNGTGKSRLSKIVGDALSCPVVDCDKFVRDGKQYYPEIIDLDSLGRTVRSALESKQRVVVEGIILLTVLDAMDLRPSTHLYVRHNWPLGSLTHRALLSPENSEAELIDEENEICRAAGIPDDAPILARELVTYHKRLRPHELADAIFDTCFSIEGDG